MSRIKISVIVPIYNVELYLKQCLDSLLNQTLKDIEVLLVNDGTRDSSDLIAKEYAKKHPQIFRYFEKSNGGLSDARNYAIPFAEGEYITFVDSDDYISPEMYNKMYRKAKENNSDIVECEFNYVYEDKKYSKSVSFPEYKTFKEYLILAYPNAWNKIYKREWLKSINIYFPKGLWHEDIEFFFKIIPHANQIPTTVHEPLYFYRQRKESIMSSPDRRILDLHKIYNNIYKYYSEIKLLNEYELTLEYKYLKTTCCSFLKRMLQIKDASFKSNIIDESWLLFTSNCPNWRKNPYLHKFSFTNIYLRLMNHKLLWLLKNIIK